MRLTSHCAYHPSREAGQRCRSCGKWLCDRCARPIQGHIFCGFKCRLHDLGKRGASRLASTLRSPVPPLWAVLARHHRNPRGGIMDRCSGECDLRQSPTIPDLRPGTLPYAVAEMVRDGDRVTIEIQGSPGATVVLFADGAPFRVLTLDEDGRASVTDVEIGIGSSIEIAVLAEPPEPIAPPPTLTPTPTATSTATATPSATATIDSHSDQGADDRAAENRHGDTHSIFIAGTDANRRPGSKRRRPSLLRFAAGSRTNRRSIPRSFTW